MKNVSGENIFLLNNIGRLNLRPTGIDILDLGGGGIVGLIF